MCSIPEGDNGLEILKRLMNRCEIRTVRTGAYLKAVIGNTLFKKLGDLDVMLVKLESVNRRYESLAGQPFVEDITKIVLIESCMRNFRIKSEMSSKARSQEECDDDNGGLIEHRFEILEHVYLYVYLYVDPHLHVIYNDFCRDGFMHAEIAVRPSALRLRQKALCPLRWAGDPRFMQSWASAVLAVAFAADRFAQRCPPCPSCQCAGVSVAPWASSTTAPSACCATVDGGPGGLCLPPARCLAGAPCALTSCRSGWATPSASSAWPPTSSPRCSTATPSRRSTLGAARTCRPTSARRSRWPASSPSWSRHALGRPAARSIY